MGSLVALRCDEHRDVLREEIAQNIADQATMNVIFRCEGQLIHAHKLVLAVCSQYLRDIVVESSLCEQLVVTMVDFKASTLRHLVHYMYCGEVLVAEEELDDLLDTAQTLQIKGLLVDKVQRRCRPADSERQSDMQVTVLPSFTLSDMVHDWQSDEEVEEACCLAAASSLPVEEAMEEPTRRLAKPAAVTQRHLCGHCEQSFTSHKDLEGHVDVSHKDVPAGFVCIICKTNFKHKMSLQGHWWRFHRTEDLSVREECLGPPAKKPKHASQPASKKKPKVQNIKSSKTAGKKTVLKIRINKPKESKTAKKEGTLKIHVNSPQEMEKVAEKEGTLKIHVNSPQEMEKGETLKNHVNSPQEMEKGETLKIPVGSPQEMEKGETLKIPVNSPQEMEKGETLKIPVGSPQEMEKGETLKIPVSSPQEIAKTAEKEEALIIHTSGPHEMDRIVEKKEVLKMHASSPQKPEREGLVNMRVDSPEKTAVKAANRCVICDKNFSTKGNLKTHTDKFHNSPCAFCDEVLVSKASLLEHVMSKHSDLLT